MRTCPVEFGSADSPKTRFHRVKECGLWTLNLVSCLQFIFSIRNPKSEIGEKDCSCKSEDVVSTLAMR